jgi:peptide deformylase
MPDIKVLTLWNDEEINEEDVRVLRAVCGDVAAPLSPDGKKQIKTLIEAFLARDDASGLAAPQIGISQRIVVFRNKGFDDKSTWTKSADDYDVLVNPRIVQSRGDKVIMAEGCLSCPDIQVEVSRFPEIKVRALDASGRKISKRYTDYLARVVQHELDHLEGKLIVDYDDGSVYFPKKKQKFFERIFQNGEPA